MFLNPKHIPLICLLFVCSLFNAQTNNKSHTVTINVPEVALLDIHTTSSLNINLSGTTISEAGKAVVFHDSNNSIWINYSSIVGAETEPYREITAEISEGEIPNGLALYIKAQEDVSMGDGKMGNVEELKKLTHSPVTIIKKIGSAYTGVGVNKGHNIQYTLKQNELENHYSKLDFDQAGPLTITYTLSDN